MNTPSLYTVGRPATKKVMWFMLMNAAYLITACFVLRVTDDQFLNFSNTCSFTRIFQQVYMWRLRREERKRITEGERYR
jgi:hypothetical protein